MSKTTFHISNYGMFGNLLPSDYDGYCHLEPKGWQEAGFSVELSKQFSKQANKQVKKADELLEKWRNK